LARDEIEPEQAVAQFQKAVSRHLLGAYHLCGFSFLILIVTIQPHGERRRLADGISPTGSRPFNDSCAQRYMAKKVEKLVMEQKPGRFWGVIGRQHLPVG
jgi:hypothetical protein